MSVDVGVGEGIEVDVHVDVNVEINAILVAVVKRCAYVLRKGVGIQVDFRWMLFVFATHDANGWIALRDRTEQRSRRSALVVRIVQLVHGTRYEI